MPLIPASVETHLIGSLSTSDLMAGLLLIGVGLLAFSLTIVRKLTKELPQGANRSRWSLLGIMILLFLCGYLGFFILNLGVSYTAPEMLVAVIFFFGAIFVLLVCLLAYRTTQELKRIHVLEQENITDPLLGIFNRRLLDRRIQEEVLRAQRYRLDLSLLMVDIDNFKKINDTWGHQVGDLVLQHLSHLLEADTRKTDVLARFGGEEFVILLPHTREHDAFKLAEKLRHAVEQSPLHRIPELRVTISIGTSSLLPDGDNAHSLLERADKSMYRAKREGRNRVVSYRNNGSAEHGENCR
jgi:diguanylate cyclase (GGDEF)-like protein